MSRTVGINPPDVVREVVPEILHRTGAMVLKVKLGQPAGLDADREMFAAAQESARATADRPVVWRVDANGGWDVADAVRALTALARHELEYAEQPCRTVAELVQLRRALARAGVDVPIAADESVRKAEDPLRVALAGAADVVVVKVAPLGGVRAALDVAQHLAGDHDLPVVVSSALDTSIGLAAGVRLAAALPRLPFACGLGTASLLATDVTARPVLPVDGVVAVRPVEPDDARLARLAATDVRRAWWVHRAARVHAVAFPGTVGDNSV